MQILNLLSAALAAISVVIIYIEGVLAARDQDKISAMERYIGQLDLRKEELDEMPTDRGFVTPEGIDLGEIVEIMQAGTKGAQRKNKQALLDQKEAVEKSTNHRRRIVQLAAIFGLASTGMQLYLAFSQAT